MFVKKTIKSTLLLGLLSLSTLPFSFNTMQRLERWVFERDDIEEPQPIQNPEKGLYVLICDENIYNNIKHTGISSDFAFIYSKESEFSIITDSIDIEQQDFLLSHEQVKDEPDNSKPQLRFLNCDFEYNDDFWTNKEKAYIQYPFYFMNSNLQKEKKQVSTESLSKIKDIIEKNENRFQLQQEIVFGQGKKIINSLEGPWLDINGQKTKLQSMLINHYEKYIHQENTTVKNWDVDLLRKCKILTVWTVITQENITKMVGLARDGDCLFHWATKLED